MVGRTGFEPATFCTSMNLMKNQSSVASLQDFDWEAFRSWLDGRNSKTWAYQVFRLAKTHQHLFYGSLEELEKFSKWKKNNVLKALVALSKFLGVYEEFRAKMKSYGVKWSYQNSVDSFLRMIKARDGLIDWVKDCIEVLDEDQATFVKFVLLSGIRAGEAVNSFNIIVRLHKRDRLEEYYNRELQNLEHYKYAETFLRGKKNVFFSFIPEDFIESVKKCQSLSYESLRHRLKRRGYPVRLKELRHYFATFMVHNGLIREEVDVLQGRIGRSLFMKHYFTPDIERLRDKTLKAVDKMVSQF
jgi:intergrase/recombinase